MTLNYSTELNSSTQHPAKCIDCTVLLAGYYVELFNCNQTKLIFIQNLNIRSYLDA